MPEEIIENEAVKIQEIDKIIKPNTASSVATTNGEYAFSDMKAFNSLEVAKQEAIRSKIGSLVKMVSGDPYCAISIGEETSKRIDEILDRASESICGQTDVPEAENLIREILNALQGYEKGTRPKPGVISRIMEFVKDTYDSASDSLTGGEYLEATLAEADKQFLIIYDRLTQNKNATQKAIEELIGAYWETQQVVAVLEKLGEKLQENVATLEEELRVAVANGSNTPEQSHELNNAQTALAEVNKIWVSWRQKQVVVQSSILAAGSSLKTSTELATATMQTKNTAITAARASLFAHKAANANNATSTAISRSQDAINELMESASQHMTQATKAAVELSTTEVLRPETLDSMAKQIGEQLLLLKDSRERGRVRMLEVAKLTNSTEEELEKAVRASIDEIIR